MPITKQGKKIKAALKKYGAERIKGVKNKLAIKKVKKKYA